ncbi:MAG: hypothetical protein COV72_04605 [Candidatus Omnitrophica bacterium CG11_big_fil_rev_8_21_14_0_20_42_13]|uniref:Membrane protein 6-pyruvoyl-tetrahydropterin synthase-related domain-containing protein n=1 Tax=Candidatus Ghiorseimicrobium undicola TaxID=1974746 RepID=A0A2H0LXJ0_9BACT|nr:MAG: hypothetical protein COV72_04605 [Candidatus Omnitrophica bacterium CG11_big_fil_rev_8_21_14_0_20_42_13]
MVFRISIYKYIVFHGTLYVIFLNMSAIYLISRQLVKNRIAAILPVFIFAFSYFQLLNFHDFYAVESMIAPLFYIFAIIRYNNKRDAKSFLLMVFCLALFLASLDNGIVMSAIFWTGIFTALLVLFNISIVKDTVRVLLNLLRSPKGRVLVVISALLVVCAVLASFSAPRYNWGHVLATRGQKVDYEKMGTITGSALTIESSQIWTILNNWLPFTDIHENYMKFAWDGHDYRYIGLITLLLISAAFTLGFRNRYVFILFLTYFICNGYIIYTKDNIVYRLLIENSSLFQNVRNMLTIFPRGGASLFLLFLSAIGLDLTLQHARSNVSTVCEDEAKTQKLFLGGIKVLWFNIILIATLMCGIILFHTKFASNCKDFTPLNAMWHVLFHMFFYLMIFSFLLRLLYLFDYRAIGRWLIIVLFIFIFMDLTISLSYHADRYKDFRGLKGCFYGRMPYSKAQIPPDDTRFRPISNESENIFPPKYVGVYHNPITVTWSTKEWLALSSSENGKKFLDTWNPVTRKSKSYPGFKFYSNAYYVPFDKIKDVEEDNSITEKRPLFYLHDNTAINRLPTQQMDGKYDILDYNFNRVAISTNTKADGFLYFLDNYDRFWSAYIDGRKTKIYRANFTFKAIKLPQGAHTVLWVYNPYPVKAAYLLFYFMIAVFVIFCIRFKSVLIGR